MPTLSSWSRGSASIKLLQESPETDDLRDVVERIPGLRNSFPPGFKVFILMNEVPWLPLFGTFPVFIRVSESWLTIRHWMKLRIFCGWGPGSSASGRPACHCPWAYRWIDTSSRCPGFRPPPRTGGRVYLRQSLNPSFSPGAPRQGRLTGRRDWCTADEAGLKPSGHWKQGFL